MIIIVTDEKLKEIQDSIMKGMNDQITLEEEIREFSKQYAAKLLEKHNAQIIAEFRDKRYLLSARSVMSARGTVVVQIREREWMYSPLSIDQGTMDPYGTAKTASAEYDNDLSMQQLVEKLLTTLFFNIYGLISSPEEIGD